MYKHTLHTCISCMHIIKYTSPNIYRKGGERTHGWASKGGARKMADDDGACGASRRMPVIPEKVDGDREVAK